MRVLSVIDPFRPAYSGEGEWWLRMIPFLRARGLEVEILTHGRSADVGPERVEGVTVHRVPMVNGDASLRTYAAALARGLLALRRRRREFRVALFHAPTHDLAFASCVAGRLGGWKTIYKATLLGSDDLDSVARSGRLGRLRLAALTLAHGVISLSRVLLGSFEERPWLRRKLLVAPQGVDLERFRPPDPGRRRAARSDIGLAEETPTALFCGALIHRKGVDVLVEAWRRVVGRLPGARLLMVGPTHRDHLTDPEDRRFSEAITGRIQDLGLADSIRVLGYRSPVEPYYTAADLFVLPSRFEGWPNVVGEAMACGLPCIVSRLHGVAEEQLGDEGAGVIVRSESPEDYADRLLALLGDRATARRMGEQARRRVLARFGVDRVADQYAAFIRRIAEGRPARHALKARPA